jgi:hypothetical protein
LSFGYLEFLGHEIMLTIGSKGRSRTIDYYLGRQNIKVPAFFSELGISVFEGMKAQSA